LKLIEMMFDMTYDEASNTTWTRWIY